MTPNRPTSSWHIEPKRILFGVLGVLMLFVIYNNERFIVDHSQPLWTYYLPVRWLLVPPWPDRGNLFMPGCYTILDEVATAPCPGASDSRPLLCDWCGDFGAAGYLYHHAAQ